MDNLKRGEKVTNIKGYEGIYAVTSFGRVWSIKRKIWLAPFYTGPRNKYSTVRLCSEGNVEDRRVHRLVGEAFIPNPDNKPQINHKNGNKQDCSVSNLEWVTARENIQHSKDYGLNKVFKFSYIEKLLICKMFHILKVKQVYLARLFEVTPSAICYIIREYSDLVLA